MNASVAILFDRLGPYHLARLRAAAEIMPVHVLEFCSESREYQWDPVEDLSLPWTTLFAGRNSASVGGWKMWQRIFTVLDAVMPGAVAVPGWSSAGSLAALDWCRCRCRPVVVMSESTAGDECRRSWKEWIKRRLVRQAGGGLVGGGPHRAYLRALGLPDERIFEGYDVVDNDHFETGADQAWQEGAARRDALGLPARYFLASNRFIEKKNLPTLLAAYAEYRRQAGETAWALVLLGDGPLREMLETQRTEMGLENALFLPGFKQYDELPAYYAFAGGFIHASTTEQWGLVVNEAMASGLPVLVSNRCGCASDLVNDGRNGWTFDPYDPAAITAALLRLASLSEAQRVEMGRAGRARIAAWTPETFADGMVKAVEAALAAPTPRRSLLDQFLLSALILRQ